MTDAQINLTGNFQVLGLAQWQGLNMKIMIISHILFVQVK